MIKSIDINCDVGEGVGNEAQLFPFIDSCNIACGGHFGDINTIRAVVKLAQQFDVKIGAHPSYPDLQNFGRVSVTMDKMAFQSSIQDQLGNISKVLQKENAALHHIKAHGALYNDLVRQEVLCDWYLEVLKVYQPIVLYVPYGSVIAEKAKYHGFEMFYEVFADRNYNEDLSLVSRKQPNAVLTDKVLVGKHVQRMFRDKKVKTIGGNLLDIKADTVCVHGDNDHVITIVKYLYNLLKSSNHG